MKIVLASSVLGLFVVACGGSDPAAADPAAPEADAGDPGVVIPPDAPPITGGCDVTQLPSQNPCVLHESLGVFVSSTQGADANDGSRARPYASIAKGIEAARATKRRVYVCAEAYAEPGITLQNAVPLFGNLVCAGGVWASGAAHAVLNATTSPAGRAEGIGSETRIEGLELVAPAATAGGSSIGLVAVGAGGLHFVGSRIAAQNGGDGEDGTEGTQLVQDAAFDGQAGHAPGSCTKSVVNGRNVYACPTQARAAGGIGRCGGGDAVLSTGPGGEGGRSAAHERQFPDNSYARAQLQCTSVPGQGQTCTYDQSERGFPAAATDDTNVGAAVTYDAHSASPAGTGVAPGQAGGVGRAGDDGSNAVPAASLSSAGYAPVDGVAGTAGGAGQGGGGGLGLVATFALDAATFKVGRGGAGGGAGGCPGLAGTAGKGGGASIAVLAIDSAFTLETSVVLAAQGGLGGKGTLGSAPTPGGQAGAADESGAQAGGAGGAAGFSGHGASGPAFAIAWKGGQPVTAPDTSVDVGAARQGQPALSGNGKTIPAGLPGNTEKVHAF